MHAAGRKTATFADEDITTRFDGLSGGHVDLHVFERESDTAGGTVGGFGGAAGFEFVTAIEALGVFEVLISVHALLLHLLKRVGRLWRRGRGRRGRIGLRATHACRHGFTIGIDRDSFWCRGLCLGL